MVVPKCDTCGGDLTLFLDSESAVCDSCGNTADVEADELVRIRKVYKEAELKAHRNSAEGYAEAIAMLQSISFVYEAREKIKCYENCLNDLKEIECKRNVEKEHADKNNGKIGVIILVLFLLILAFVIAGVVYIIYHIKAGDLSPIAIGSIVTVVAISIASPGTGYEQNRLYQ